MGKSMMETLVASDEDKRLLKQEMAIMDVTELICEIMEEQGISRSQLAEKLGTSKSNVTQMLDGRRNLTVRKISDILHVLGHTVRFGVRQKRSSVRTTPLKLHVHTEQQDVHWQDWSCSSPRVLIAQGKDGEHRLKPRSLSRNAS